MRKAIASCIVVLLGTACSNKPSAPAAGQPVPGAAVTKAEAEVPAAPPHVEQTAPRTVAVTNTKKSVRHVKVAKTIQQEPTQQKFPVSEGMRKDGPG